MVPARGASAEGRKGTDTWILVFLGVLGVFSDRPVTAKLQRRREGTSERHAGPWAKALENQPQAGRLRIED